MSKNSRESMRKDAELASGWKRPDRVLRRLWVGSAVVLAWLATCSLVLAQTPPVPLADGEVEPAAQVAPAPADARANEGLKMPRPTSRLEALPPLPPPLGVTPKTSEAAAAKVGKYVQQFVDPETTVELIVDQTRLLVLKQPPKRVQIANEGVACYVILSPREISLIGKCVGVTVLTLWFSDPADATRVETLTYQVRVLPDPEGKCRLELVFKALADEINKCFCDSNVCLELVGDKLVLKGFAKDVAEATQIIRIVRASYLDHRRRLDWRPDAAYVPAVRVSTGVGPNPVNPDGHADPGMDEYQLAGGPEIINLLKVGGEQQVMLKVTVAEVNRAAARSIGLNFNLLNGSNDPFFASTVGNIGMGGQAGFNGGTGFGGLGFGGFRGQGRGFISTIPGYSLGLGGFMNLPVSLDGGQINLAFSALRNLNYAKSLAEPNIIAYNGRTGTFHAGGSFPVPIVTGFTSSGLQGVDFVPYGVRVSFTPYVTDRDRIRLELSAEVSSRDLSTGNSLIGGSAIPNMITRNFNTVVEMREGQTFAVAGLIQTNLGGEGHRVPFFGDLPVIGRLAAFDRVTAGEQELMILITPVLVRPLECNQVPPVPGSDLIEPGDLEFYLLGRLEGRRGYDYRSPVMTDIDRMKMYRRCEQLYMTGPHGNSCPTCPQP